MSVGLVIGKFCPPHKGHALVVERALADTQRVIVVVFDAPACPWPVARRVAWLGRLFPTVRVLSLPDLPGAQDAQWWRYELMFRRALDERVTHVFSSELYGRRLAASLGAQSVEVDPERRLQPISATLIRQDPRRFREFLEPFVFAAITEEGPCAG